MFEGNARRGDVQKIAHSLQANGQYRPLVVRRETSEVLAGNHTFQAAQLLGWESVLVTYLDGLTDAQARKIVLVDNKSNDAAGYDDTALAQPARRHGRRLRRNRLRRRRGDPGACSTFSRPSRPAGTRTSTTSPTRRPTHR
nr:ParB N-terminal domain-containing protein [Nocardioides convexus]